MVAERAVAPNAMTVAVVLAACRDAGALVLGRWMEDWVKCAGIEVGWLVGSALVGMYEKCGEMGDTIAWNAMITGYVQNSMSKEVVSLFHSMRQAGARPDKISLVGVLSVYAAVGALELGTELDSYASKRGFYSNVYIGTALVDMDPKCGNLTRAIQVFGKLPCKNEASWNALICGRAFNGRDPEASYSAV
ncbi:hypothetical protein ACQJBY_012561 [Aegilops geniculata]